MTPISQMTEEELRVAVAEAMGWTLGQPKTGQGAFHWRTEKKYMPGYNDQRPNYPTDANAAESLCNALGEKGWKFGCARHRSSGTWSVWFEMDEETSHSSVNQPTLSIAIARAYLAVVQAQTPTT